MGHLNGHIVHDTQHHIGRHLLQTDRCGFKQNLAQNPWSKFWHEHAQIIDTVVKRKKEYKIGLIPPYLMRSNRMLPCRCFEDTLSPDGWEVDPHMKLMSCLVQKTTFALSKSLVVVGTGFEGYWPPLWFERRFLCVWVQPKKKTRFCLHQKHKKLVPHPHPGKNHHQKNSSPKAKIKGTSKNIPNPHDESSSKWNVRLR